MIITSFLMGGLGNQMFQISKALSEGYNNSIDVVFRPSSFVPMNGNQPTKYLDNVYRNLTFKEINEKLERISEPSWSFTETNIFYYKSIEFYGYYQSSKNFKSQTEKIKTCFSPTEEFIEKIKNLYPKIFDKESVSIHVRRGDYLTVSEILPVIDKTYIDECLRQIGEYSNIFIFSNEKEWCKENLNYNNSVVVEDLEDYEELWMMSLCNNNIMSNSSFSWWASYLNKNIDKQVYVPSIWFGPKGEKNYQDIYEDGWVKINVKCENGKLIYKNNNLIKKKIKLFDENFAHATFTTDYQISKHIEWDRNYQNTQDGEIVLLTDNCMMVSNKVNGKKIGMIMEPRSINPHIYNYVEDNNDDLETILTYDKSLINQSTKFEFYPHCGCWIQPENQIIYPKTKLLSIIASHKQQTVGHKLRHSSINLTKELNINLDVFGNGYTPVTHKIEAMKDYGFTIVIENSKIDYYFTEKLIDSFMTGTIPIYWGCPSIGDFFNLDGMLIFDDLNTLLIHLNSLSLDKYSTMIDAVKENFEKAKNYLIAEDWIHNNTKIFK